MAGSELAVAVRGWAAGSELTAAAVRGLAASSEFVAVAERAPSSRRPVNLARIVASLRKLRLSIASVRGREPSLVLGRYGIMKLLIS